MGYLPLDDLGATIFYQLVSTRYDASFATNSCGKPTQGRAGQTRRLLFFCSITPHNHDVSVQPGKIYAARTTVGFVKLMIVCLS